MHMNQIGSSLGDCSRDPASRLQVPSESTFSTDLDQINSMAQVSQGARQASDNDATNRERVGGMHARHKKNTQGRHGILTWAIARTTSPSPSARMNMTSSFKKV